MSPSEEDRRIQSNLHGTINLAVPISWQLITAVLAGIVVSVAAFLATATYARTEIASGSVIPEGGILKIIPSRSGRVEEVLVGEGDLVRAGTLLARIGVEESDRAGAPIRSAVLAALDEQDARLSEQVQLARAAAGEEGARFAAHIEGLRSEITNLDARIVLQKQLIEIAESDFNRMKEVAGRGFISRRDLSDRQESLLERQQQYWGLQELRATRAGELRQVERARRRAAAEASAASLSLLATRAQAKKEEALARAEQGYSLIAPATGLVTAISIHRGDTIGPGDVAMIVLPAGKRLIAQMHIPAMAAGFVRPGQEVRLAFDAYPIDRFGSVIGKITTVSSAPVVRPTPSGAIAPFFIANATMNSPAVHAYGREQRMLPGMTFTARIVTRKRTIAEWLFDPLYAAARS